MIRPTASGRIAPIPPIVPIHSDTSNLWPLPSNLYLHIFTGKFVRFPPFSNIHVGNLKSPRGYFLFSTWASKNSSEVSFDSSEEFFIPHVEISKYPRGDHFSPTRRRFDM